VQVPRLSPAAYRRVTLFALIALGVIIVTGAAVRLSGSGLGCPTWPSCDTGHLVPHAENGHKGWIEFVNRAFTGGVSLLVALAVLGSLVRVPRRRDLTWLSIGLVGGVIGQIVLGGLVVKFGLAPPYVIGHFVLSIVLVADAVVLHHRAGEPDGPPRLIVTPEVAAMSRLLIVAAGLVIATGTIVTGAGPHGGDETSARLDFVVRDVARVHGIAENLFLVGVLVTLWLLHRTNAPHVVRRDAQALLAVLVAQAAVGYTQYATGVPELLVAVHIVGAVSVWVAVLRFHLHLWRRAEPEPAPASVHAALVNAG
jgi:cytochrome c oxidase assembly protein subunit 15